jgi:hypothetical protein
MKKLSDPEHKQIALWAANCAEHVLHLFEEYYPNDYRPRRAIEAAQAWANGELSITQARYCAFEAHKAAREVNHPQAILAARSAGHAAATAHVALHAKHAASYAAKSAINPITEKDWQFSNAPYQLVATLESFHILPI